MDEYIVKHLLKKNKEMSKSEAEKKAAEIWDAYCEVNKERDEKREKEDQDNRRDLIFGFFGFFMFVHPSPTV